MHDVEEIQNPNMKHRFQYISCQFESLRPLRKAAEIRKALHDLPKGLDATYNRMLQRINRENRSMLQGC